MHTKEADMPVKVSYPGYSSEAEYRAAIADKLAAKAAFDTANDSSLDATARRLAPIIEKLREKKGRGSTRKLVQSINEIGMVGPKGKPLNYGTMRRILQRMPKLGLGEGLRSQSRAANDRDTPYYFRPEKQQSTPAGFKGTQADSAKAGS